MVTNKYNTRLTHVIKRRRCTMMYKDIAFGKLVEEMDVNGNLGYIFILDYPEFDKAELLGMNGVPGIDTSKRLEEYVRVNVLPVFLSERTPSAARPDLAELCHKWGLDWYDRFEYMIRQGGHKNADKRWVCRTEDDEEFDDANERIPLC